MKLRHLSIAFCLTLATSFSQAAPVNIKTEKHNIQVKTIAEGFKPLWGIALLPDGNILVTERVGNMRIVSPDGKIGAPLTGVPKVVAESQGGLLDVVLAPDFATSKKIYFSYSEPGANNLNSTAVSFATLNGNKLDNVTRVFSQVPKIAGGAHFGSRLVWADDGTLFITTGDRWTEKDQAQLLNNHIGKVLRINADGSVPKDNPFLKTAGALPEIWSYGHRNMQGAAINPISRDLWTSEHGPQGGDELNANRPGKNYGWPVITYGENYGGGKIGEGTAKAGMEQPVYKWVPSIGTGGFIFYTGNKFPAWKNNVLLASLRDKSLVRLEIEGEKVTKEERLLTKEINQRLRQIVQSADGLLYVITDEDNSKIYQISPQ